MKRFASLSLLIIIGLVLFARGLMATEQIASPSYSSSVEVSGTVITLRNGDSAYALDLKYESSDPFKPDEIMVYAEPSHTLLLAYVNEASGNSGILTDEAAEKRKALGVTRGPITGTVHTKLAYAPGNDTRIVLKLLQGGNEYLLSNGRVNVPSFGFSIGFNASEIMNAALISPSSKPMLLPNIRVCCKSNRCGEECTTCGVDWCCDFVTCEIHCGSC